MCKEKFYQENIEPKLIELADLCHKNGLTLITVCECTPETYDVVRSKPVHEPSFAFKMIEKAIESSGNINKFCMEMERRIYQTNNYQQHNRRGK